jgi:excisionase family DNA binding protein
MAEQGLMTLDEAAAYLGVAKITLRRWTRKGELPCVRIGKRGDRRFRQEDLDAYISRNATQGSDGPNRDAPARGKRHRKKS